ncbi:rhomboid protein 1, mitochondrial [[Candida] anglica]|uniref:Rhomboid protein 1, mitochondrial n=1 Tax=[Candida] anglica TaxID=148631 RepID=A0ABP0EI74_9ASCO
MFKVLFPSVRIKPTQSFFNNGFLTSFSSRSLRFNTLKQSHAFTSNQSFPVLKSSFGFTNFFKSTLLKNKHSSISNQTRGFYRNANFSRAAWRTLQGPALFTAGFCVATTLVTPYLFSYTPLAYFKRNPYVLIYSIIAANGAVFLMWRAPQLQSILMKYFLMTKLRLGSNWALLGAAFSHQSLTHFLVNMFVLHSFGTSLCAMIGASNFFAFYLNSAVIASFLSLALPVLTRSNLAVGSLGASGAIFSVFGTFSYLIPKAPIAFFFFPIPGGAWVAFLGGFAYNIAGMALKWSRFDFAAHIGGCIAGLGYGWWYDRKRKNMRSSVRRIVYT